MATYINIKTDGQTETIDEFETRREAIKMLKEYRIASSWYVGAYLSNRSTKDWRNDERP